MLTKKQLAQAIHLYLERKYTQYAILIDGDWGIGKTHFLTQEVLPNASHTRYVYISLYGLSSISEIENEIFKSMSIDLGDDKQYLGNPKEFDIHSLSGASLGGLSYAVRYLIAKQAISNSGNENLVLCFDDVERWNGDLDLCFSFINKLVEHDQLKCVLLGNSRELNETNLKTLYKARQKTIRHIYKFANTAEEAIKISLGMVDFKSTRSKRYVSKVIAENCSSLTRFLSKIGETNIRTLSEAIQLFDAIYVKNQKAFKRSERLPFTYFVTLLSTLLLLKKHFIHEHERSTLFEYCEHDKHGLGLLKKLGYFEKDSPRHINAETRKLLDTIFYRLDEISLKGVFSIIQNGVYVEQDFKNAFDHWNEEQRFEKYLDKFYFYQLEENESLELIDQVIDDIFERQSITNPATLLLLAERLLMDIQRDVINLDLSATRQRFRHLFETLYKEQRMDSVDLNYLELRESRYRTSNALLETVLAMNKGYRFQLEQGELKQFWQQLRTNPNDSLKLLYQYSGYPILNQYEDTDSAIAVLSKMKNREIYRFAQQLLERREDPEMRTVIAQESENAGKLAQAIYEAFKNEYGIRASNMKDLANILLYQVDENDGVPLNIAS